jgi:molecular chaperone GrpE (heat shock protein)
MLDFETELNKLLFRERGMLPQYEFAELAAVGQNLLAELGKKQTDASLQIEEIYDLVKEQHGLMEALEAEKTAKDQLAAAAIGIADLIEYFHAYAAQSGREELKKQADVMWQNAAGMLASCGILRFGVAGEQLDPRIHTVKASAESSFPREYVTEVLQSGYLYQNRLLRKAAVVVSRGQGYAARPVSEEADAADADKYGTMEMARYSDSTDDNPDDNADDRYGITESAAYAYGADDNPDDNADNGYNAADATNQADDNPNDNADNGYNAQEVARHADDEDNADGTIEHGDKYEYQTPEVYPGEIQDQNKEGERL